jgi:hypothetical protein
MWEYNKGNSFKMWDSLVQSQSQSSKCGKINDSAAGRLGRPAEGRHEMWEKNQKCGKMWEKCCPIGKNFAFFCSKGKNFAIFWHFLKKS